MKAFAIDVIGRNNDELLPRSSFVMYMMRKGNAEWNKTEFW